MSYQWVFFLMASYFLLLFFIAHLTTKNTTSSSFFNADNQSPWYLVAFGMIGTTLSGVTFISVPGMVGIDYPAGEGKFAMSYLQMVFGYMIGYFAILTILMPLYYKLDSVSIYSFLEKRFGITSYKTGSFFFLLSRSLQAASKLYVVALVLQSFIFDELNISFFWTVLFTIILIWLYTFKGGLKTVVWTDTLQTTFMLLAAGVTVYMLSVDLGEKGVFEGDWWNKRTDLTQIFFFGEDGRNFYRQLFNGALLAFVMTGLDQDMMQKNLSCRNLKEAQKNMFWFSIVLFFVNILFLGLGAMLYLYAEQYDITVIGDKLYPLIAKEHIGILGASVFVLGIVAASYSSADSALTALTTAFCIDFLGYGRKGSESDDKKLSRKTVHIGFSVLLFLLVLAFKALNNKSAIDLVLKLASYTYGPLLGMFALGIISKINVKDKRVPLVVVAAPALSYVLEQNSVAWFDYRFSYEILVVNALLTMIGMVLIREEK
ncbi:sodium:solute symporter [Sediminitomix flava]|uniref:Na+/proline symporter n=1 Tax=Sediminitomix flava TaxID=379075 RepID=A0A315ZEB6_SEDFL|nr:sodium:solute symporter [Sediminitomix flava]PWJ43956.1 Na+/proline symporter [Sediminitomix flava]